MPDPIYKSSDGKTYTRQQLISAGYSDERIDKGLESGKLNLIGDTELPDQSFVAKDGKMYTTKQLLESGYSQERINNGVYNGVLSPQQIIVKEFTPDVKKKSGSISYEHTPYVSEVQSLSENAFKDIQDIYEAKELSGKTNKRTVGSSYGIQTYVSDDKEAQEKGAALVKSLNEKGYTQEDIESLYNDFKDFPSKDAKGVNYNALIQERKENPIGYQRTLASYKWQVPLFKAIREKDGKDADIKINTILSEQGAANYTKKRRDTADLISSVREYVKDTGQQDKIINEIKKDRAISYGILDEDKWQSIQSDKRYIGQGGGLNQAQIIGLQFLEDTDPTKAQLYNRFMSIKPEREKGKEDLIIGYEQKAKYLEDLGMSLQAKALEEQMSSLILKKNKGQINDGDIANYQKLYEQYSTLLQDAEEQKNRYPTTAAMEADRLMQEANGQRSGAVKRGILGIGENVDDLVNFVGDVVKSPFRSEGEKIIDDLEDLGSKEFINTFQRYRTQANQLVGNDGKINFTTSAIFNTISDVGSEVLSNMATTALTGGFGNVSKARSLSSLFGGVFGTTYNDYYTDAIRRDIPNPTTYAISQTAKEAAVELINPDLDAVKKIVKPNTTFGKIIKNTTKEEWDEIVKASKGRFIPVLDALKKTAIEGGKNAFRETFEEIVSQVGGNVIDASMFNQDIDLVDGLKSTVVNTLVGTLPLGFLGMPGQIAQLNRSQKYALYEVAQNKEKYLPQLDIDVKNGLLTPEKADQIRTIIENASKSLNEISAKNTINIEQADNDKTDILAEQLGVEDIKGHMAFGQDVELEQKLKSNETVSEVEKGESLQYFVDKAGEAPVAFEKRFGKEMTDKMLEKVPTEKLVENYKFLAKIDENSPEAVRLDEIIGERESNTSEQPEVSTTASTELSRGDVGAVKGNGKKIISKALGEKDTNGDDFKQTKVVDENGKPKQVFHGTWADAPFEDFKEGDTYFTDNYDTAKMFGINREGGVDTENMDMQGKPFVMEVTDTKGNKHKKVIANTDMASIFSDLQYDVSPVGEWDGKDLEYFDSDSIEHHFGVSKNKVKSLKIEERKVGKNVDDFGVSKHYINIENPLIIDAKGDIWNGSKGGDIQGKINEARESGKYDGVIVKNIVEGGLGNPDTKPTTTYVVFNKKSTPKDQSLSPNIEPKDQNISSPINTQTDGERQRWEEGRQDVLIQPQTETSGGEAIPPAEPPLPTPEGREFDNKPKSILNRIYESKNVSESFKERFRDDPKGLRYNPKSHEIARKMAKELVSEFGDVDAVSMAEANRFDGDVNSMIFAEAIDKAFLEEQNATTQGGKILAAEKWADYAVRFDESARQKGRFISAIYDFYKKSPLGIILIERAKRTEAFNDWFVKREKPYKEVFNAIKEEPEFKELLKEKVAELTKQERAASRLRRRKKIEDIFDSAKIKGDQLSLSIVPPPIWNAAVEIMKKAALANEEILNVIEKGVQYIKDNYKEAWDEQSFRDKWNEKLGGLDAEGKSPITTEEKQQKILDKFRKKLTGLTEEQKEDVIRKSFKKLVEAGALNYDDFKKIISDTLGFGEMTAEEVTMLSGFVKDMNAVQDLSDALIKNESLEALKLFEEGVKKAEKSATQLAGMLYNKPKVAQRIRSIIQLNTLGIVSLIKNPFYNIFHQLLVRLPKGIFMTGLDQFIYGATLLGNKIFGNPVIRPDINILLAQRGYFKKGGEGFKQAIKQVFTGLTNKDYFQKEVYNTQIKPFQSWRDIWAWGKGDKNLTKGQIADKALQGTLGIPAEITARFLNIGDKPFRYAAEAAIAETIAIKDFKLSGIEKEIFMRLPKEKAKQIYKKRGLSEEDATKKSEEVEKRIISEGEEAVFQQSNVISEVIAKLKETISSKDSEHPLAPVGSGAAKIVGLLNMPFVKTPANIAWEVFNLVNPEFALMQSFFYGIRAAKTKSQADYLKSKKWMAHAATGWALLAATGYLASIGAINGDDEDEPFKPKEANAKQNYDRSFSLNISKLFRAFNSEGTGTEDGDVMIDLSWFGATGMVMNMQANKYENMTKEERENMSYIDEVLFRMKSGAQDGLVNSVFEGSLTAVDAIRSGRADQWLLGMMNVGANLIEPATIAQISRATRPHEYKITDDSLSEKAENSIKARFFGNLPPKINVWGEEMKRESGAKDVAMRMLGVSKYDKDKFGTPIFEDFKRTGNSKFLPPDVSSDFTLNGKSVKLNAEESDKLKILVGNARASLVAPFINGVADVDGKRYSDLNDEQKIYMLGKLYSKGYDYGKKQYLKLSPELAAEDKVPEPKRRKTRSERIIDRKLKKLTP